MTTNTDYMDGDDYILRTVNDLGRNELDWIFVSDSQDVQAIKESYPAAAEYDSFFVLVGDGDYTAIVGMYGIVPYLNRNVYRIL